MFLFGNEEKEGWFFTPQFNVYQKVNKNVYVYVSRQFGFYTLQMYERGTVSLCTFEARSENNIQALFKLGESWLEEYQDFVHEEIMACPYYIGNPNLRNVFWIA